MIQLFVFDDRKFIFGSLKLFYLNTKRSTGELSKRAYIPQACCAGEGCSNDCKLCDRGYRKILFISVDLM